MKAVYVSSRDPVGPARFAQRLVTEIMSKPVIISVHSLLDDALIQMVRAGVRHLAVIDDAGRGVGVLSDRAITAAWAVDYAALTHRSVGTVLDREPATVGIRDRVATAARLMHTNGVDAVAVLDDRGQPVGMVTGGDLVSLLAR